MENVADAEIYFMTIIILLTTLIFIQLRAFARPKPVPLKRLPRRPALQILFKPDDFFPGSSDAATSKTATQSDSQSLSSRLRLRNPSDVMRSVKESLFRRHTDSADFPISSPDRQKSENLQQNRLDELSDTEDNPNYEESPMPQTSSAESPFLHLKDLPDSFAPLLSSSHVEYIFNQLTTDLIHAVQVEGEVRIREGRHEIPLDKDNSRPQFVIEPPNGGCRVTAVATIGSDGFSMEQDLDVSRPTPSRSRPMVKRAGVVLDPPLPLKNVAPTLIHFPTLFEDRSVPTLRQIQIVRIVIDLIVSLSSFLEKVLWIIESKCQIHLSKVQIIPLYKGKRYQDESPEWRLSLSFSGHALLFGWIPIPFINVTLPTIIIPQPHALLEFLMTPQPLASAKLKRENIAEKRIALASLNFIESWNIDAKAVATPPALGVDLTLSGGVSLAIELMPARDHGAGIRRYDVTEQQNVLSTSNGEPLEHFSSSNSLSTWTTRGQENSNYRYGRKGAASLKSPSSVAAGIINAPAFDANDLVPWLFEFTAKGMVSRDRISVNISKCSVTNEENSQAGRSSFSTSGSLAIWKADIATVLSSKAIPPEKRSSFGHLAALATSDEAPSIGEILLYADEINCSSSPSNILRMLGYDYAFDVFDSQLDAITCCVGASHPMLRGGTMVTTILESIYMNGSATARQGAIINPGEWQKKRNILRHLPAVDLTFGIQNAYIPPESLSYSDDGQVRCLPEMEGGRVMVRFLGGIESKGDSFDDLYLLNSHSSEGIKVIADIGIESVSLKNESFVKEFPELDIFEGAKLKTLLSGAFTAQVSSHLRPQLLASTMSTTGPNIKNPLEAYEIDFRNSSLSFKVKESSATLGHRRIIIPTETTIAVKIVESVVDMSLEGTTQCELCWDFQGLSPILQVTEPGQSPADATHENKRQVSVLIAPLRQGRLNFHVSPVGGIVITKAKTSREDREGLYDWKFFNALVSPDNESAKLLLKVVHDKRTMGKLLQVMELINTDLHKIMRYILKQVWRAKEIFDQEGISDPGHVIPGQKMARLVSLFMCGDVSQAGVVLPIIRRVTSGDGLDVVKVKELLRKHVEAYDEWAPEIDRVVNWTALLLGPLVPPQNVVEGEVPPLSEIPQHSSRFHNIPSASLLYTRIHDKVSLPLESSFSNLVSIVSPYLSLAQVEYFLQVRKPSDWQPSDLRRLRYVYAVKKKVLEISESYGGLSFLPQSFLVSVFLGEATRASLRVARHGAKHKRHISRQWSSGNVGSNKVSTLSVLRRRRMQAPDLSKLGNIDESVEGDYIATPAGRVASQGNFVDDKSLSNIPENLFFDFSGDTVNIPRTDVTPYELGDSLLGPADVAILLQAGLTSAMKSSTVVQLNQRMLLDLIATQPRSFAVAVLAEIGIHGGQGSPRGLTSALMALLELDQSSFTPINRLDMHALLESWLPGFKVPRRDDYMAGGRWARQSYYEALFSVSKSILEDAECYMALKSHIQRDRRYKENDPLPLTREARDSTGDLSLGLNLSSLSNSHPQGSRLSATIEIAKKSIHEADSLGHDIMDSLVRSEEETKRSHGFSVAISAYRNAFEACTRVLELDKLAFHADWFRIFYQRNYDALMIQSMHSNVMDDVDKVRHWFSALRRGSSARTTSQTGHPLLQPLGAPDSYLEDSRPTIPRPEKNLLEEIGGFIANIGKPSVQERLAELEGVNVFNDPHRYGEQAVLDAIIDAIIYREVDRNALKADPLVRLLIPNPPGKYDFAIVSAMGVITEGQRGKELEVAFQRLKKQRGVEVVRSDTGTARSFEYNAAKIIEAIEEVSMMKKPYGLLGYSQGCANALTAESMLLSGSPKQQAYLYGRDSRLVCRQLMFSAANGSTHGPAADIKVQRLIVMCEEFFKYQQGYFSRAFASLVLEHLNNLMDSAAFQKIIGGAQSFLPDGCRAFWREAQHLAHIPTCTMRGVLESHTIPESLEMISHLLTKQSGSALHDSQVHVYDAVGYPVYCSNRNGRLLKKCAVGDGAIQRTHHWSPLSDEVEFVQTQRDIVQGSFECAKDRHVFPWVDVNVRFGFIKYLSKDNEEIIATDEVTVEDNEAFDTGNSHQVDSPRSWVDLNR
jgi:hypothetical protein